MTIHYRNSSTTPLQAKPVTRDHLRTPGLMHRAKPAGAETESPGGAFHKAPYRNGGKRIFDLTLCLLGAPFVLLIVAVLALLIARDGGSPFYSQLRVGKNGRLYRIWKLRSMVPNADEMLKAYLADNPTAQAEWDKKQKLKSDPRITRIGALLRRSSLDELPQLWNVVKGDMSLVGPRPMMPAQIPLYPGQDYYALRPGITGSWQVSKRNESSFADRAGFDTSYNRNVSLSEDIRILKKTVRVVLSATGY